MPHVHGAGWRGSIRHQGKLIRQGGFPTKAAAARWERQTLADLERGTWRDPDAGAVLFVDWSARWLASRMTLKPSAQVAEESICRVHLVPAFGRMRIDKIKPSAVAAFVGELSKRRSGKTVSNVHAQLFVMFRDAVRDDLLVKNPCEGTRLPKPRRRDLATLTEQELYRLIAAVPERWRPMVVLAASTGMRWGEVAGLKVRYVDLFAPALRVEETLNEARGRFTWGTPKSRAGHRRISLPSAAVDVLAPLIVAKDGDDLVFTTEAGGPVRHRNFDTRVWQPACAAAGLSDPRPTFHSLRHTHAALLIAANVPVAAIKERLGHESITTTIDTYGYLLPRVDAGITAALDGVFGTVEPQVVPIDEDRPV